MRIAVMGSGGTGGYFGGLLAHAGEDVTFIARGAHLAALRAGGLTITSRLVGDLVIAGEPSGGDSPRIGRMLRTFDHAGIPSQSHPEIQIAIWEKFVFICAFGGLTALTRLPIGPILASRECRALFEGVMQEVLVVAAARGITLPTGTLERGVALADGFEPWARGSLLHDLESGRRMELEALNGTVVRLARAHGLPVPFNSTVYAALQPYAEGAPSLPTAAAASA